MAVSALRSALAAIENAGAVEPGQAPPPGQRSDRRSGRRDSARPRSPAAALGRTRSARWSAAEVEQRRAAAREYADLGRPDQAERLRAEADVLAAHLRS